jgi:hypothetical protein
VRISSLVRAYARDTTHTWVPFSFHRVLSYIDEVISTLIVITARLLKQKKRERKKEKKEKRYIALLPFLLRNVTSGTDYLRVQEFKTMNE